MYCTNYQCDSIYYIVIYLGLDNLQSADYVFRPQIRLIACKNNIVIRRKTLIYLS